MKDWDAQKYFSSKGLPAAWYSDAALIAAGGHLDGTLDFLEVHAYPDWEVLPLKPPPPCPCAPVDHALAALRFCLEAFSPTGLEPCLETKKLYVMDSRCVGKFACSYW